MESRLERAIRKNRPDIVAELETELDTPPFPVAVSYIWDAWQRLRSRKGPGFSGHLPIEWSDIDAFMRATKKRLAPWEVEMIEMIDDAFLDQVAKAASDADRNQALKDGLKGKRTVNRGGDASP